jgi:Protein of unknown function (DUF3298)
MRNVRWVGVVCVMAMGSAAMWAGAPKSKMTVERIQGGVAFVRSSVTLTAADTRPVTSPSMDETAGKGTLKASWPQAQNESPEWKAWNVAVFHATQLVAAEGFQGKAQSADADGWSRLAVADTEAEVTARVKHVDERFVTTKIENDLFEHDFAHPGESWIYFHWLLKEQRELQAADVFAVGSGWESVVDKDCRAGLSATMPAGSWPQTWQGAELDKGLKTTIATPRNWVIGAKGLTIVFPEYAVAPRVAHPKNVTVSWTELKPFLAKGFVPPSQ